MASDAKSTAFATPLFWIIMPGVTGDTYRINEGTLKRSLLDADSSRGREAMRGVRGGGALPSQALIAMFCFTGALCFLGCVGALGCTSVEQIYTVFSSHACAWSRLKLFLMLVSSYGFGMLCVLCASDSVAVRGQAAQNLRYSVPQFPVVVAQCKHSIFPKRGNVITKLGVHDAAP